jgi:hypothetical protein
MSIEYVAIVRRAPSAILAEVEHTTGRVPRAEVRNCLARVNNNASAITTLPLLK